MARAVAVVRPVNQPTFGVPNIFSVQSNHITGRNRYIGRRINAMSYQYGSAVTQTKKKFLVAATFGVFRQKLLHPGGAGHFHLYGTIVLSGQHLIFIETRCGYLTLSLCLALPTILAWIKGSLGTGLNIRVGRLVLSTGPGSRKRRIGAGGKTQTNQQKGKGSQPQPYSSCVSRQFCSC